MKHSSIRTILVLGILAFVASPVLAANSTNASPFAVLSEAVIDGGASINAGFGDGEMEPIGDFDQNGTEDFLVGAYRSFGDTGSVYIEMLNSDGTYKGRFIVEPKMYSAPTGTFSNYVGFGTSLTVLKKFTPATNSCAEFITYSYSATNYTNYVVKLCRNGTSLIPTLLLKSDTTITALAGTGLKSSQLGRSMRLIDTLENDELLVAINAMFANGGSGKIYLMGLNSARTTWRRIGIIDSTLEMSGRLKATDYFGGSISMIPDQDGDGINDIAVLAQGDDSYKANHGAIYILPITDKFQVGSSVKKITAAQVPALQGITAFASSLATGDFNHDSIADLVVGSILNSGSTFNNEGSVSILTLLSTGVVDSVAVVKKGHLGFTDLGGKIDRNNYYLGIKVQAFDFNHDGMLDLFAGADNHQLYGGIWAFKMKSNPWVKSPNAVGQIAADLLPSKTYTVLVLDTVFGGSGLSYNLTYAGDPAIGSCVIVSGSQSILACNPGQNTGSTFVTVEVTDGNNVPSTDRFPISHNIPINIFAGNQPPASVSLPTTIHLNEDFLETDLLKLDTAITDLDGPNALTFSLSQIGTSMTSSIVNGKLRIKPISNANGTATLTITANDGLASSDFELTLIIDPIADAPTTVKDSISTKEDVAASIPVLSNDVDADGAAPALAIGTVTNPTNGTAIIKGTSILYTPKLNFSGLDTISYTATDGALSTKGLAIILVTPVNDPPTVKSPLGSRTIPEDTASFKIPINSIFADVETPAASLFLTLLKPCDATLATTKRDINQPGFLLIAPVANANGRCTVVLQASDEDEAIVTDTLTLTISPVPDVFKFTWEKKEKFGHIIEVLRSRPVSIEFDDVDVDGDPLTYVWKTLPSWLTWNPKTYTLTDVTNEVRTSQKVIVSVYEGKSTVVSDTSTVTFLSVDSASKTLPQQRTSTRIPLHVPNYTLSLMDFSGRYSANLWSLDGRNLWSQISQKSLGESIQLALPPTIGLSILKITSSDHLQTFILNYP